MRAAQRPKAPAALRGRSLEYGMRYFRRRLKKPGAEFSWPQLDKIKLNHHLLPTLKSMTDAHCAYCDGFPIEGVSLETIDHFRPKSTFPWLCCVWRNLFYACDACQNHKGEDFDSALLKPDALDYEFDRYFLYDHASGHLMPNPANDADRERAQATIDALGLNESDRPASRRRAARHFHRLSAAEQVDEIDDFPYRFALR